MNLKEKVEGTHGEMLYIIGASFVSGVMACLLALRLGGVIQ